MGMFVSVCRGGQLCVSCARLLAVVSKWRGVLQFVEVIVHESHARAARHELKKHTHPNAASCVQTHSTCC